MDKDQLEILALDDNKLVVLTASEVEVRLGLALTELRLVALIPASLLTVPVPELDPPVREHLQVPLEQSTTHWQEQEVVSKTSGLLQVVIVLQMQSQTESSQCLFVGH